MHALIIMQKSQLQIQNKISKGNAEWAAKCLDVKLGDEVGYKYRSPDGFIQKLKLNYYIAQMVIF